MRFWRKGIHKEYLRAEMALSSTRMNQLESQAEETARYFNEIAKRLTDTADEVTTSLKESNEQEFKQRFFAFAEQLNDGVLLFTTEGTIVFANQAAKTLFQSTELIGTDISDLFKFNACTSKECSEYQIKITDQLIDVDVSLSNIEINEQVLISAIIRDISERKRLERQTKEHQEVIRTVFDVTPNPIVIKNDTGKILDVNSAYCELSGYDKPAIIGKTVSELYDNDVADTINQQDLAALSTGTTQRYRGTFRNKFKQEFRGDYFRKQFRLESGKSGLVGSFQDLTETLEQADALKRSRDILETTSSAARRFLFKDRSFDSTVVHVLKKVCEALKAKDACVLRVQKSGLMKKVYATCSTPTCAPTEFDLNEVSPEWVQKFKRFEVIESKYSDLALELQAVFCCSNMRSFVAVPLFVDQEFNGIMLVDDSTSDRKYTEEEIVALKSLAGTLAGAFERRRQEALLESSDHVLRALNVFSTSLLNGCWDTAVRLGLQELQTATNALDVQVFKVSGSASIMRWAVQEQDNLIVDLDQPEISSVLEMIKTYQRPIPKSFDLYAPVIVQGEFWGYFLFRFEHQPRIDYASIQICAQTFGSAIEAERRQSQIERERIQKDELSAIHESLMRISPIPLCSHDLSTVLEVNTALTNQMDVQYEDVVGSEMRSWVHPDDLPVVLTSIQKTLSTHEHDVIFIRLTNKRDQFAVFRVDSTSLIINEKPRVLCFMEKISDHQSDPDLEDIVQKYQNRSRRRSDIF